MVILIVVLVLAHEYEARKIISSASNIIEFYNSRSSTHDPGGEQTLRNRDQIVLEGLQNMDIKTQLVACDAMRYSFYSPFLVMIKHSQTDILTVGKYIHKSYQS